jgi:hypothetical protein
MLSKYLAWMLNLSTSGARKVTSKEWFKHKHKWVPVISSETLQGNMSQNSHHLPNRNTHANTSSYILDDSLRIPTCPHFCLVLSVPNDACHLAIAISGKEIR